MTSPLPFAPEQQAYFQELDARASVLMKRGIAQMTTPGGNITEALSCFDQALVLREQLPAAQVPQFAYGTAACWMNRGEALTRLGGGGRWGAAVQSYDEAIVLLRRLPLDADDRYRRRLAIALQNRGLTLFAHVPGSAADAVQGFTDALAVLEDPAAAAAEDHDYMVAAVLLNLGNAQRANDAGTASQARSTIARALGLMAPHEAQDERAAEVGLKGRHLLCQMLADPLSQEAEAAAMDDVHAATDAVDSGLDLIRDWERKGVLRFREVAADLFRFGAMVYQRYQPQFLDEFVEERTQDFPPAVS
jgi:hypothetical protein